MVETLLQHGAKVEMATKVSVSVTANEITIKFFFHVIELTLLAVYIGQNSYVYTQCA